eukprot:gene4023-101_t
MASDYANATMHPASGASTPIVNYCNYCHTTLKPGQIIKCVICMDFELCVDCYAVGVELAGHKKEHLCRILGEVTAEAFPHSGWQAEEEVQLLEGISLKGLGHWAAVAQHCGGDRTPQECCDHFYDYCFPAWNQMRQAEPSLRPATHMTDPALGPTPFHALVGPDGCADWAVFPDKVWGPRAVHCCPFHLYAPPPPRTAAGMLKGTNEVSGWNRYRQEFEQEFDPDAELVVSSESKLGPDTLEMQVQMTLLDGYQRRRHHRKVRREFALGHGFHKWKQILRSDKGRSNLEKADSLKWRPYQRFLASQEHKDMMEDVNDITLLYHTIQQLLDAHQSEDCLKGLQRLVNNLRKKDTDKDKRMYKYLDRVISNIPVEVTRHKTKSGASSWRIYGDPLQPAPLVSYPESTLCQQLAQQPDWYLTLKESFLRVEFLPQLSWQKEDDLYPHQLPQLAMMQNQSSLQKTLDFFTNSSWCQHPAEPPSTPADDASPALLPASPLGETTSSDLSSLLCPSSPAGYAGTVPRFS